jgi:tetratricopeptide (TPR) repeat protein
MAMLGIMLDGLGRYQEAMTWHQRALELARSNNLVLRELVALTNLASAYVRVEEHQTALDLQEQARRVTEQAGETWPLGTIREGLAWALIGLGRYEDALAQAEQSVATHRSFAQVVYRLRAYAAVGSALHGLGRHAEAVDYLTAALRECREHGNPRPTALLLNTLGETLTAIGDTEEALARHTEAMALADRHRNQPERTRAQIGLGDAYAALGELHLARNCWQKALDDAVRSGLPVAARLEARLRDVARSGTGG